MKICRSELDEMQEKKLLQIEHRACWLGFFGLTAAILLQEIFGSEPRAAAGETAVLLLMAVYLVGGCIRSGIWDRRLKPNFRTNLLISAGVGAGIGLLWFGVSYYRYHKLLGSAATFVFMAFFTAALCLAALSLSAAACRKRRTQLEQQADKEESGD